MHMEDLYVCVIRAVNREQVDALLWYPMPGLSVLLDQGRDPQTREPRLQGHRARRGRRGAPERGGRAGGGGGEGRGAVIGLYQAPEPGCLFVSMAAPPATTKWQVRLFPGVRC